MKAKYQSEPAHTLVELDPSQATVLTTASLRLGEIQPLLGN